VTKGFWQACEDVGVDEAFIVAPVESGWPVEEGVRVIGVMDIAERMQDLKKRPSENHQVFALEKSVFTSK